ncbi:MAG: DUF2306 domain-containing protein [Pseudomonadota bacterium]
MRPWISTTLLLLLAANTSWFVVYSAQLGWQAVTAEEPGAVSRVFAETSALASFAVALHMISGALLTIAAPLQAMPPLRRYWPGVHRRAGYMIYVLALLTGAGGLIYIAANGTVGGLWMSFWFAVYGLALGVSAYKTVAYARQRDMARHFAWATRLVILAVGSWIYRMHYGLWFMTMKGAGVQPDFKGLFDLIQVFAFFVPYLLIAEVLLRRSRAKQSGAVQSA